MSRFLLLLKPILRLIIACFITSSALALDFEPQSSMNGETLSPAPLDGIETDPLPSASVEDLSKFYQNPFFTPNTPTSSSRDYNSNESQATFDGSQALENYGLDSVDLQFHSIGDIMSAFNNSCDRVAQQVGETVYNLVTPRLLAGPKDIVRACPQWPQLSEHDRRDFYIGLVTAMAMAESSCNNNARARGTTSTAYGLWQGTRPRSPLEGARWVMRQIDSQVAQSGLLFWSNNIRNYWAVLNPSIHAFKVQAMLRKIPRCVVGALVQSKKQAPAQQTKPNNSRTKLVTQNSKDSRITQNIVKVSKAQTESKSIQTKKPAPAVKQKQQRRPRYKKYRVFHRHPRPHWHIRYRRIYN